MGAGSVTPLVYTPEECAELAQLHPETIVRMCRRGELKATKPAGRWRIYREDFERWLRECEPRDPGIGHAPRRRLQAVRGGFRELLEAK
jgi:excisionase family DNA binding protein